MGKNNFLTFKTISLIYSWFQWVCTAAVKFFSQCNFLLDLGLFIHGIICNWLTNLTKRLEQQASALVHHWLLPIPVMVYKKIENRFGCQISTEECIQKKCHGKLFKYLHIVEVTQSVWKLKFYVKSKLVYMETQNLPFYWEGLSFTLYEFLNFLKATSTKIRVPKMAKMAFSQFLDPPNHYAPETFKMWN